MADKIYQVHARMEIVCSKEVAADGIVDAAEKAAKLRFGDFLPEGFVVEYDNEERFEIEALFA